MLKNIIYTVLEKLKVRGASLIERQEGVLFKLGNAFLKQKGEVYMIYDKTFKPAKQH